MDKSNHKIIYNLPQTTSIPPKKLNADFGGIQTKEFTKESIINAKNKAVTNVRFSMAEKPIINVNIESRASDNVIGVAGYINNASETLIINTDNLFASEIIITSMRMEVIAKNGNTNVDYYSNNKEKINLGELVNFLHKNQELKSSKGIINNLLYENYHIQVKNV